MGQDHTKLVDLPTPAGEPEPDAKKLARIILCNRGCVAHIDNDNWQIVKDLPDDWDDLNDEQQDQWYDAEGLIASNHEFPELGISYGYGILEALAHIVGMHLEMA